MSNRLKSIIFKFISVGLCFIYTSHLSAEKEFWLISPQNPKAHGFFSCFNLVLGHLYFHENETFENVSGIEIDFGNQGNYYSPAHGSNWWEYYFEPLSLGSKQNSLVTRSSFKVNKLAWHTRRTLERGEVSDLLHKYVNVKSEILAKVVQFTERNFSEYMIGVHYRGTDKKYEAPQVPYVKVLTTLLEQIDLLEGRPFSIFVATDEQSFLNYIESLFPGQVVSTDSTRSENSSNVHVGSKKPHLIGEEALIDAILLSKCNLLIRTSSSLSLWSTYYNKNLTEILLNNRNGYPAE